MTSVLIADDQALVRVGLRKILEAEPETTVVGEAGDGEDAITEARRLRPDVVLMDIRMPVLDGIEATRRIVRDRSATRVLMLTTFGLDNYVYDALRAGASGFMLKDAPPEEIAAAVRIIASGEALLAPAITRAVIEEFAKQSPAPPSTPPRAVEGADTARARSARPARARTLQLRDLRTARHQRSNRKDARRTHPPEARPARPRPGRDLRLRDRARRARLAPLRRRRRTTPTRAVRSWPVGLRPESLCQQKMQP